MPAACRVVRYSESASDGLAGAIGGAGTTSRAQKPWDDALGDEFKEVVQERIEGMRLDAGGHCGDDIEQA
jgi:hypothetical protein